MFYKPKHCSNCGEKIERTDWRLWSSRRFCSLCETEFAGQIWIPRIVGGFFLVVGIAGFGGYFQQNAEKSLKISASSLSNDAPRSRKDLSVPTPSISIQTNAQTVAPPAVNPSEQKQKSASAATSTQNAQLETAKNQLNIVESVYFCGAATKKSTACSRRVKGGGRCWQHAGQPAILPPEKLIASR